MMDDDVLFHAFLNVLKMLDEEKSIDEICRYFNISKDFLFNHLFTKYKFARSGDDFTEEDKRKIEEFKKDHTDTTLVTWALSGMRYLAGKREGKYEGVLLSPVFFPYTILKFVEAGADFETLKRISYGDITTLERDYRWAMELIEDESGKIKTGK